MPRRTTITRTWSTIPGTRERKRRTYTVTYVDDSEERAEAIAFFGESLFPALDLPESLDRMSEHDAQEFLDAHPIQRRWHMLTLDNKLTFVDDDLQRLEHFPELEHLHSHANHLTDRGVAYISRISELRHLVIYSPLITDACLEDIAKLRCLQTIDLQGSHLVSRKAFDALVAKLHHLVDIYPPFDLPLSEVFAQARRPQDAQGTSSPDSPPPNAT